MIQTQVQTRIGIRPQIILFQLNYVVEKTVRSGPLKEIIRYTVPLQCLSSFSLWGLRGREAHARFTVSIDYDRDGSPITISTQQQFGDSGTITDDPGLQNATMAADADNHRCPIWTEAVDWFMRLCAEKHLQLHWTVTFGARQAEMRERFGLVVVAHDDRTADAPAHTIPNTILSECMITSVLSKELYSPGGASPS